MAADLLARVLLGYRKRRCGARPSAMAADSLAAKPISARARYATSGSTPALMEFIMIAAISARVVEFCGASSSDPSGWLMPWITPTLSAHCEALTAYELVDAWSGSS